MKKNLIYFFIVTALLTIAVSLGFAGGEKEAAPEKVTLRFMTQPGHNAAGFKAQIEEYEKSNPNTEIKLDIVPDLEEYLRNAFLIFSSKDAPEIAWYNMTEANRFQTMCSKGLLREMDDLYKQFGWDKIYPPGTIDYLRNVNGHIYGVNLDVVWTPFVYYNKAIFKEAGIDKPGTWDEFKGSVNKVRSVGYQPVSMVYEMSVKSHLWGAIYARSMSDEAYVALLSNWRSDSTPTQRKYKWTDPDGVRIWQYMKLIADSGGLADGFAGLIDYDGARGLFTTGKAAMYQDGSWAAGAAMLPKEANFEWDYFIYPPIRSDKAFNSPYGVWLAAGLCLPKASSTPEKDTSVDQFLEWSISKEGILLFAKESGATLGRFDIKPQDLAEILSPVQKDILANLPSVSQVALIEAGIPREVYEVQMDSVDKVLTAGVSSADAAKMLQDVYDKWQTKTE